MRKTKEAQHALHNDKSLADFHFILGQEPSCFLMDGEVKLPGTNPRWARFVPDGRKKRQPPVRSCIWASREIAVTQLRADSADITAVMAYINQRRILIVSVYIPDLCWKRSKEENSEKLTSRLEVINRLVETELLRDPHTEVVIAGDFNRHNPLWGGSHVGSAPRQEESEPIIEFMAERSLQSLLPAGALTYQSDVGRAPTIDLILTTPGLASDLAKCSIWEHEYGSDHRAICTRFWMDTSKEEVQERLLFKNAPWDKIREAVQRQKEAGFYAIPIPP